MRHCQYCNRNYSDKYLRNHCRSNKHLDKAFGVKYTYKTEKILVNEIDNTLSNIVEKHRRKYHSFYIVSKINNKKIIGYPKRILLKYYDNTELINVEFNLYSNRDDMTFNHYILQPKPMIETMMIKFLDKYPQKLKILEYIGASYYEYLILEYYGFAVINPDNSIVYCVRNDWLNNAPKEPDDDFKEILRNIQSFFLDNK